MNKSWIGAALSLLLCACASPPAQQAHWVSSWGAAQMAADPKDEIAAAEAVDVSVRQTVRVSLGGSVLRVRFSNAFGTAPLHIDGASVAIAAAPGRSDVDASTLRALRFGGERAVTIAPGAELGSDAVDLPHAAGADIAVSMHIAAWPGRQTSHPGSRASTFYTTGDKVGDAAWPQARSTPHWYQLAGVEVQAAPAARSVVVIGDSITDGYGVPADSNRRWTDFLATRLRGAGIKDTGVINAGIGGGRLLRDGLGPSMVARFERDVLAREGVSHAIVLIGINDLGGLHRSAQASPQARARLLEDIERAHRQLVAQAHQRGVCVIGATVTPHGASGYYVLNDDIAQDRKALNDWIRNAGVFDGVIDFDAALRDPARPEFISKPYDNDGLHPSTTGYQAMADAVPLALLAACSVAAPARP
jgi:lysophospholipase L1-like esterase